MTTPNSSPLERFRSAIRIATAWPDDVRANSKEAAEAEKPLSEFQDFLVSAYPEFHRVAERTSLSPFSVLYRWPAAERPEGKPVLFMAHYDVVPVEKEHWSVDPFAAEILGDFVYGRGTLDTKNTLIATLEAAETLAASGFSPARDIYFAFGGDEERSGTYGAKRTAAYFADKGIAFDWILDEGSVITEGLPSGVKVPLALIGVEEKGFLDLELIVKQAPGHASRPPRVQAVAVLGAALARLGKKPFPFELTPIAENFFRELAPYMPPLHAAVMGHARLLGPLFFRAAGTSPETEALLRTTLAMTQLQGSPADNVLPSEAKAVLNLRLLPGWTIDRATEYVRRAIGDARVEVKVSETRAANDPIVATPDVAEGRGPGWKELGDSIRKSYPEAVVLPYLMTATTDSRYYAPFSDAVYRFVPIKLGAADLALLHGHDERISIENFTVSIEFYRSLISGL